MPQVGDVVHAEIEDDLVPDVELHVPEHPVGVAGRGEDSEGGDHQDQDEDQDHGGVTEVLGKQRLSLETELRPGRTSRILMMITVNRVAEVLGVLIETEKMKKSESRLYTGVRAESP